MKRTIFDQFCFSLIRGLLLIVLSLSGGCGVDVSVLLPDEAIDPVDATRFTLLTRFVHISDAQIVDEESPARLTPAANLSGSAWRAQEAYSTQLLDGTIRTINKLHVATSRIDFVIHTGDATDNIQQNELDWFVTAMDGGVIQPRTGPDDRDPTALPEPLLDPHAAFVAQGLYKNGVHGNASTIAWYAVVGNHDRFAVGVFPIVANILGRRVGPLPLENRFPFVFPVVLDPTGSVAIGAITPANPGPPALINPPTLIAANPNRRYLTDAEFVAAHLASATNPPGHGFSSQSPGQTWYSVSPTPGLRLIALDSARPLFERPTVAYSEGAISTPQLAFLRSELTAAPNRGETVIVATHHPSGSLEPTYGTALTTRSMRALLQSFACVKVHLAGHWHQNVVFDRGGYVEIVTGAIIDAPQQGRIVELWRAIDGSGEIELRYRSFSHLDEISPPSEGDAELFNDPLMPMRRKAAELAGVAVAIP